MEFSQLQNKVELIGRILSEPSIRFDERTQQKILTFTLAVSREGLPMTYNLDDYNYFVCRVSERLVSGEKIMSAMKMLHEGMVIKVYGILESKPYTDRNIRTRSVNVRACQAFTNFILVVEWKDGRPFIEDLERLKKETDALREIFGTDADINWVEKKNNETAKRQDSDYTELPDF